MNIPNRLTALAADISDALKREAANRSEWVEIKLDLCRLFAEAKTEFPSKPEFGQWCKEHAASINEHDRTGYTMMGADLAKARQIFEATKRTSVQTIYEKEFKQHSAKVSGKALHARPKPTPELEKALHAYDRRKLAGEDLTYEAIKEEAGLASTTAVRRAIAMRRAEEQIDKQEELSLSMSAQEKFDAKVRAFRKSFDYEVETAARRMQKEWAEESLQRYSERLTKFERQLVFRPGVMKASEYKTLMLCCHPDTAGNVGDAKRNEATRILTEYRLKLMNEKEDSFVSKHGLPRTREELDRAREEVRARNSARSKAAHAARKQREKT